MGYIQSNDEKHKKLHVPLLRLPSNRPKHRWRPRLLGSNQNDDNPNGILKTILTPILLRKNGN